MITSGSLENYRKNLRKATLSQAVLWIRIRIRVRMVLGLPDPHPDPLVTSSDPDPHPHPNLLDRGTDPRIRRNRIRTKMSRIHNTDRKKI